MEKFSLKACIMQRRLIGIGSEYHTSSKKDAASFYTIGIPRPIFESAYL